MITRRVKDFSSLTNEFLLKIRLIKREWPKNSIFFLLHFCSTKFNQPFIHFFKKLLSKRSLFWNFIKFLKVILKERSMTWVWVMKKNHAVFVNLMIQSFGPIKLSFIGFCPFIFSPIFKTLTIFFCPVLLFKIVFKK